jgi:hypothetical protein
MNSAFLVGYVVVIIVIRILFIWWCVSMARKKGRDTVSAGLLGFLFGLWAVIGYALVSSKKKGNESLNCPICHDITEIKIAKTGKNMGKQFYVCVNYPECKGRIQVRRKAL